MQRPDPIGKMVDSPASAGDDGGQAIEQKLARSQGFASRQPHPRRNWQPVQRFASHFQTDLRTHDLRLLAQRRLPIGGPKVRPDLTDRGSRGRLDAFGATDDQETVREIAEQTVVHDGTPCQHGVGTTAQGSVVGDRGQLAEQVVQKCRVFFERRLGHDDRWCLYARQGEIPGRVPQARTSQRTRQLGATEAWPCQRTPRGRLGCRVRTHRAEPTEAQRVIHRDDDHTLGPEHPNRV
ncbi:MAG: hypothetical protein KDK91_34070, partial [Gammaproteobacteria bacterium]|nr:hypothetical protein [Gammaproteobacteria bacterium]